MVTILNLFILGISLSMDTFSLSLSIGTFNISKHKSLFFSICVGVMHFIMPIIGKVLGLKIIFFLNINGNLLLGIILLLIDLEMVFDLLKEEEKEIDLNIISLFILAISVSLDSFSTGLGLNAITDKDILPSLIFSFLSFFFTYIGLLIGKYSNKKLGIYAQILGIFILLLVGVFHIFINFCIIS